MDSQSLTAEGFSVWLPFNTASCDAMLAAAPTEVGVYVIRRNTPFPRIRDESDILYIGSATNRDGLRMRLRHYFHPGPTQWTNQRLLARCGDSSDYDISFVTCANEDAALELEIGLLTRYRGDHLELPPENRSMPGKTRKATLGVGEPRKALVRTVASNNQRVRTEGATGSKLPTSFDVWTRIEAHAGEQFRLVRGAPFTYTVAHGCVVPDRTNHQLPKSHFEKALLRVPLKNTAVVQDLRGPSFIYAILMDERIRDGDW